MEAVSKKIKDAKLRNVQRRSPHNPQFSSADEKLALYANLKMVKHRGPVCCSCWHHRCLCRAGLYQFHEPEYCAITKKSGSRHQKAVGSLTS
jgi:hypothetical protein